MKTRKIYVLLTRFHDTGSKIIEWMTGEHYPHVSIGLEEDMNTFYSFVFKGFIVEDITRYAYRDVEPYRCQLYEMGVSEAEYDSIKDDLKNYEENKEKLSYTRFGLVMCLLRIAYKKRDRYFCSQFVAEVLKKAKVTNLKKNSALCLSEDFRRLPELRLNFQGTLIGMLQQFSVLPGFV